MKRWFSIIVLLALAAGLASFFLLRKPRHVTYAGELIATSKPLPELRISADNQPVSGYRVAYEIAHRGLHISLATVTFDVRGKGFRWKPPEVPPAIAAEMLFPCGWKPLKLKVLKVPTPDEIRGAAETGTALNIAFSIEQGFPRDWMKVWVDNRGGKQVQLSVGEVSYSIPAGSYENWDFAVPDCAEGATVKLNGTPIGTVPQRGDPELHFAGNFLVDASGNRCYRSRDLRYSVLGWTTMEPETRYYRRKGLHKLELGWIHFFLKPAPKTISSQEFSLMGSPSALEFVHELVDVPCT